jgi:predicted fused transcriptional regulator/phosphomethylpyrimidine kinase
MEKDKKMNQDIEKDKKTNEDMVNEVDELGLQVEEELSQMFETEQKEWDIEEIRKVAKKTYDLIFDNYEDGQENGVETSNFSLLEKEDETMVYILTKK